MSEQLLISQVEFAKLVGVTKQAVSKAVKEGRIQLMLDHTDGKMKINKDLASKQWRESTIPRTENAKIMNIFRPTLEKKDSSLGEKSDLFDDDTDSQQPDLIKAKTESEILKGKLLDLELKEKTGELISSATAKKEGFKLGRLTRDAILNVPSQICNELAAESDSYIIHQKLTAALTAALEDLYKKGQEQYEEIMKDEEENGGE